ncbi:MAG: hypothetical protein R2715_02910 [Ilumatobacteraceae bacterium]
MPGADRPNASNVNYKAGQTIANSVVANVGGNGQVCIYSYANAYVLVDVAGTARLISARSRCDGRPPGRPSVSSRPW